MVDDLLKKHQLVEMSRDQVNDLLGVPPVTAHFREYDYVYWLGQERGAFAIDSEWLVLKFKGMWSQTLPWLPTRVLSNKRMKLTKRPRLAARARVRLRAPVASQLIRGRSADKALRNATQDKGDSSRGSMQMSGDRAVIGSHAAPGVSKCRMKQDSARDMVALAVGAATRAVQNAARRGRIRLSIEGAHPTRRRA